MLRRPLTFNVRDHGVAFDEAVAAFRDPLRVAQVDDREDYGEERMNLLGICGGGDCDCIRMISARRAVKHEQEDYYRENAY